MPLALIKGNNIVAINLAPDGWRKLDKKYFEPGMSYPTYRDGRTTGTVTVTRGMWSGEQLYTMPGCSTVLPRANVTLNDSTLDAFVVTQLATTRPVASRPRGQLLPTDSIRAIAKRIGHEIGRGVRLDPATLDSLDFRAAAISTGARARPTIVVSFIDPQGGDLGPGRGNTAHVFATADDDGTGYRPSFSHAVNGDAAAAEYRAFVDHLDMTGDGVDELVIDGWRYGTPTSSRVFAWRNGTWREVFVARGSWCLDPPKQ